MQTYSFSLEEITRLKLALKIRINELDALVRETSDIVSRLTNYTADCGGSATDAAGNSEIRILPIKKISYLWRL